VFGNHFTTVEILIERGSIVNYRGTETGLHASSGAGFMEMTILLMDKYGASLAVRDAYGQTPAYAAVAGGNLDVLRLFIERKASIFVLDDFGNTLFHYAAKNDSKGDMIRFLHKKGLSVNAKNKFGQTPYFFAKSTVACNTLYELGADPFIVDNDGNTVIHDSASLGEYPLCHSLEPDAIAWFLDIGLDVHAKNNQGQTPLHLAGTLKAAKLLISRGARLDIKDKNGITPLDIFKEKEDEDYDSII